ncbi:hypothetical protein [Taibaiella chishuiensis]|uniref:Uncharacterized protein n=1 Tax=Taibaiella chishuiensis TaxID=1434707 RepID=A0A2P8D1V9_9BACT|nr:hypothetical protein [Taibaiella chishuiensis]PSK91204.1 hypothetical protein B0I18_106216 [Taibaiella chishuiensis]
MELHIIEDDLICNIQLAFREHYPCLDLWFYKNPYQTGITPLQPEKLDQQLPIAEITMFHNGGYIDISPDRCLAGVEADFFHKFGLCVRVMRLSGEPPSSLNGSHNPSLQQLNDSGFNKASSLTPYNSGTAPRRNIPSSSSNI